MTNVTRASISGLTRAEPLVADAFGAGAPLVGDDVVETFRTLALAVDHVMASPSPWAVAVMGAGDSGRGRFVVAEMMARALSELRPPVCFVEVDPGSPVRPERSAAVLPGFSVVPLGREIAAGPSVVLDAVRRTVDAQLGAGHSVVIDTPPATDSSLAFAVAQLADAVVYVAKAGGRASDDHARVREQLDLLGAKVLGIVVEDG